MIKGTRSGIVCCLILMVLAFFACSQPRWKGTITNEGGVIVVRNPMEPLYRTPIIDLKEDLSIGGASAEGENAVADISDFVVDDDENIYILDRKNFHVQVYDSSGNYVRTIGRKGQGPGELELSFMISLVRSTEELAIHQATRRLSFFRTDGTFVRDHSYKDLFAGRSVCDSVGHIYVMEIRHGDNGSRSIIKKLASDGSLLATLGDVPFISSGKYNPFAPVSWFRIDTNDNFVYSYPETYEIQFFGASDAKVFKKVIRDYEPVPVTAEERSEQENNYQGTNTVFYFPKFHPAFGWFFLSDRGHVLVATFEKTADGKIIHDIFDPKGRFVGRVPLKRVGVCIFKGKYYSREEDAEGYPVLKRYAVTWLIK